MVTYPFDTFHTRMCNDMGSTKKNRLYISCFQCMSKTHLDEGKRGFIKGIEVLALQAFIRALLGLPVYEFTKQMIEPRVEDTSINQFF